MILPPRLKDGDKIGIVAPSRRISPAQIDPALVVLTSWGLTPSVGNYLFSSSHSYLAGSDEERRKDFQQMIDDPEITAIFCARGGYGSTRIIDDIDFSSLVKHPKWIVGFSDITAFHLRLQQIGIASIHGTMPIFFGKEEAQSSVESIRAILFDGKCEIDCPPNGFNRAGRCEAAVIGGNLSLIVDSLNTPSEPDTDNKILVLEEVDEYYYKVDRMLTQLRRAGKLKKLAGLIIGHMTDMKDSDLAFGETVQDIILHAVRDYAYPVAFSFPSGHNNPNHAWIEGGTATLDVGVGGVKLSYPDLYLPGRT